MKHEWRKKEKTLYLPKNEPTFIDVPEFKYISIKGEGNPSGDFFTKCIQTLYSVAYGIRMSYKWETPPENYFEYTVYPLEGIWDLIDSSKYVKNQLDKNNLKFELMIRQPEFVDEALFNQAIELIEKKNPNQLLSHVAFKNFTEGACIQMLHVGSFDSEQTSFDIMESYCEEIGYERLSKAHREIYLSDPKKTDAEKMKTVLRFNVVK